MKRNTVASLIFFCLLLRPGFLKAQFENSGVLKNEAGVIDSYPGWVNNASGSYFGSMGGRFVHTGPTSKTFANYGEYHAESGHVDTFTGPLGENGDIEIGGTKKPSFFHVDLDNGAENLTIITNTEGISIGGVLNFGNGITATLRNLHHIGSIVFEPGASYVNAGTDIQHVDGYVSKKGNTPFKFPVGSNNDIRTLEISSPENSSAHIAVAWITGNPSSTPDPSDAMVLHSTSIKKGGVTEVMSAGQWDLIYVVPPINPLTVTVSIPNASLFAPKDALRLVGWDGSGWVDLSNSATATSNSEDGLLTGTIPNNSTITALGIGAVQSALPVRLISFQAYVEEISAAKLEWVTKEEIDNNYFDIEHSVNARDFETIGRVAGGGTNVSVSKYSFLHHPITPFGIHYYRIRQVDFDGSSTYSSIRAIEFKDAISVVYPNPSAGKVNIQIANWKNLESMVITDLSGLEVYRSKDKKPLFQIDLRHLPTAVYLFRINYVGGYFSSQKIILGNTN